MSRKKLITLMSDFVVKIFGSFFIAGVTAAAGAIIESAGNFGKNKGFVGLKMTEVSWETWRDFTSTTTNTPPRQQEFNFYTPPSYARQQTQEPRIPVSEYRF